MCIHDGFYSSSVPAVLQPICWASEKTPFVSQRAPSPTSSVPTSSNSSTNREEFISNTENIPREPSSLCLTQRLGKGAVGDGWRGTFSLPSKTGIVLDVVAKVGWRGDAGEILLHEACIHDSLRQHNINGVPRVIGLFDDIDDRVPILITTYAGERIHVVDDSLKYVTIPLFVVSTR
jgi:hypothetical protein